MIILSLKIFSKDYGLCIKKDAQRHAKRRKKRIKVRTMCGSRTGGWSLPCVMSD
jgi:hypothetical protein